MALRPENTIAAFETAIGQVGAEAVELDIRQTVDRTLIIHHDARINPRLCANGNGTFLLHPPLISQTTFAELRKLDCGIPVGLSRGTRVPTLDEVFTATKDMRTPSGQAPRYDLHIKWDPATIRAADYVTLILDVVRAHGVLDRVNLANDTSPILTEARKQEPSVSLIFLTTEHGAKQGYQPAVDSAAQAVAPVGLSLDAATVRKLHAQGFRVIPWTVNSPEGWESLIGMGVDGIITDNPLGLKQLTRHQLDPGKISDVTN
jgi:glycerophosphoryl diester phosphodiesterase